ncbi:MAG: dTDP-glucose 4,6-dehydratase [Candidatus Marinimicrobia bacterium]|mgnify:CR=1 FL=1|nr:dTDP-glucose 4,6-dehydratase [Candidatus Neomarinimicrobiota bacterium]MDP6456399.1 dTDP-glucose 4,6-dehydratase [Candidatus Neomarinimicrobiota bacterium]MDP6593657.1 dTDP-glucose 4,6-dehydratase [Candidatus Neomarinimicrobiota bacterium]MDP6836207.1 dTDP-glucose 4,6-dehydratase [Candidatus Neomarinimicrobiota bacterium]
MTTYLITGGCGFIGSNFIRYLMASDRSSRIVNLDKLTYAGNPENLKDLEDNSRYHFVHGDICDSALIEGVFNDFSPDVVINFAAESHVDRSIGKPDDFIRTDVFGVFVLLGAAKDHGIDLFLQISTDEVYGSIEDGSFRETDSLMPSSPYSASKAGGDRLAYSYFVTYKIPVIVTRASNNFGPYQYPEKLIPLFVTNALENELLPLYGKGDNVRDWIYVIDHCSAIDFLLKKGEPGETYNVGGGNERQNVEITRLILEHLDKPASLIRYVNDRKGHDQRYSLNCDKIKSMGWEPQHSFEAALEETVVWYKNNEAWWKRLKSGEFLEFYKSYYGLELT